MHKSGALVGCLFGLATVLAPIKLGELESVVSLEIIGRNESLQKSEDILKDFSPILLEEYHSGELHIQLHDLSTNKQRAEYKHLDQTINIGCEYCMSSCSTSSIPHELGHHINYMKEGQLTTATNSFDTFSELMTTRRLQPDAFGFTLAQKKLLRLHQQILATKKLQSALNYCFFAEIALTDADKLVSFAQEKSLGEPLADPVRISGELLAESMSFCEEEGLLEQVTKEEKALNDKYWAIYSDKRLETPINTRIMAEEYNPDPFLIERRKLVIFSRGLAAILEEQTSTAKEKQNLAAYIRSNNILLQLQENIISDTEPHDAIVAEQFAAAVASLYYSYVGSWEWPPLYFTLTPDLLTYFENYEYKGAHIFASHVKKYREAPGLEEYWANLNIKVDE